MVGLIQKTARAAIRKHGSQNKASRALGISQPLLSQLANGKRRSIHPRTAKKLGLRIETVLQETPGA
jgi:DNA-binding transcriptional regulator YdaS (Cro superfamily)